MESKNRNIDEFSIFMGRFLCFRQKNLGNFPFSNGKIHAESMLSYEKTGSGEKNEKPKSPSQTVQKRFLDGGE